VATQRQYPKALLTLFATAMATLLFGAPVLFYYLTSILEWLAGLW